MNTLSSLQFDWLDRELMVSLATIAVLLFLSGFFSGSETALTAASRARILQLAKTGSYRAKIASRLVETREHLIGALLLGNNLVNILASALATRMFLSLFGDAGIVYATLAMTALVLIFSEILPKTWAIAMPERFALAISRPVSVFVALFGPLAIGLLTMVRSIMRICGIDVNARTAVLSAHEELRGTLDLQHREGGIVKDERDRIGGLLDLADLEVSDVMVHRTNMVALNVDDDREKIVRTVLASPYTRIPLWRDKPDNFVAILHAKDLLRALSDAGGRAADIDIEKIARAPWFIPDTASLPGQLNVFLRRKAHLALVVDEYGEVMGLVTLEDILEEIVGEIADEHDIDMPGVTRQGDGAVMIDGSVTIRDLNRAMDWDLPDERATTVAGLVIHEARIIPDERQVFTFHGFRFTVMRRERNRLARLRVAPLGVAHGPAAGRGPGPTGNK